MSIISSLALLKFPTSKTTDSALRPSGSGYVATPTTLVIDNSKKEKSMNNSRTAPLSENSMLSSFHFYLKANFLNL